MEKNKSNINTLPKSRKIDWLADHPVKPSKPKQEVNKNRLDQPPIFSAFDISHIHSNEIKRLNRNHLILKTIKENPQITPYILAKKLHFDYSSVLKICKDLEYCGLILSHSIISDKNRVNKLLYVPQEALNE